MGVAEEYMKVRRNSHSIFMEVQHIKGLNGQKCKRKRVVSSCTLTNFFLHPNYFTHFKNDFQISLSKIFPEHLELILLILDLPIWNLKKCIPERIFPMIFCLMDFLFRNTLCLYNPYSGNTFFLEPLF